MKLVDILARDLKDWPKGVKAIEQSSTSLALFEAGKYCLQHKKYCVGELADDSENAVVTRAQWQSAVDALKAREQEWDGEGLPPVGTVCEVPDGPDYREATIIAYYKDMAVFAFDDEDGHPYVETCLPLECRPIRTAEQIAAEERDRAINEMVFGACGCEPDGGNTSAFMICGYLYDAGYRKQVQP